MDIQTRIFIAPDEFREFLEHASAAGGTVYYEDGSPRPDTVWKSGSPIRARLVERLSAPRHVDSPHLLELVPRTSSREDPRCVISLQFGGVDGHALYISSMSARTDDPGTLDFAKALRRWLSQRSDAGVDAVSNDGHRATRKADRVTPGAKLLVRRGQLLRQRGVANITYEISDVARRDA